MPIVLSRRQMWEWEGDTVMAFGHFLVTCGSMKCDGSVPMRSLSSEWRRPFDWSGACCILFRISAQQENVDCQFNCDLRLRDGKSISIDLTNDVHDLKLSADQRHLNACCHSSPASNQNHASGAHIDDINCTSGFVQGWSTRNRCHCEYELLSHVRLFVEQSDDSGHNVECLFHFDPIERTPTNTAHVYHISKGKLVKPLSGWAWK
jgi:hypothetical protein